MAISKTTVLTAEERRRIRDYIPALSNRPEGADLPASLDRLMDAVDADVGDLTALTTTAQGSCVAAINEVDGDVANLAIWLQRVQNSVSGFPEIGDGGTDGYLRTSTNAAYRLAGQMYEKASTDDLWDLRAESDTGVGDWRAYWLELNTAGTASFAAGSTSSVSEADAIAKLPAPTASRSVIGVYVAGNSCDFNGAAGLAAQGTIFDGFADEIL